MSKRSGIKWRDRDIAEINREVSRFNEKIRREVMQHPSKERYLPKQLNAQDLMKNIGTRQDYDRTIKSIERAFKPGAFLQKKTLAGKTTTRYEYQEVQIMKQSVNAKLAAKREKVLGTEATDRGKPTGLTRGEMGDARTNELMPIKRNVDKISPDDWDSFVASMRKKLASNYWGEKAKVYKDNYIQAIETTYGGWMQGIDDFVDFLDRQDPEAFVRTYEQDEQGDIDFIYDPNDAMQMLLLRFDALKRVWGVE